MQGQGAGARLDKKDADDTEYFDAMVRTAQQIAQSTVADFNQGKQGRRSETEGEAYRVRIAQAQEGQNVRFSNWTRTTTC